MGSASGIEWTDSTWNPIRGCSRVSEGCRNCYAERVAYRFSGAGQPYEGLAQLVNGHAAWTGKVDLVEKHLLDPLKWGAVAVHAVRCGKTVLGSQAACTCPPRNGKSHAPDQRSRRIFVNSMSDLFHPNVPDEWIARIVAVVVVTPQHDYQVLTKRPERMEPLLARESFWKMVEREVAKLRPDYADDLALGSACVGTPLQNLWLGVSVEDQKTADERVTLLLQTRAAVRFISYEPGLGAIRLGGYGFEGVGSDLDWVICGGETAKKRGEARPMHPDWVRGLRDQCVGAGVPFFFKQWGEWAPFDARDYNLMPVPPNGPRVQRIGTEVWMERVGRKAAGSVLDGREWKEFPRG